MDQKCTNQTPPHYENAIPHNISPFLTTFTPLFLSWTNLLPGKMHISPPTPINKGLCHGKAALRRASPELSSNNASRSR